MTSLKVICWFSVTASLWVAPNPLWAVYLTLGNHHLSWRLKHIVLHIIWSWANHLSLQCWTYADHARWKTNLGQSVELLRWESSHWTCPCSAKWFPPESWTSGCRLVLGKMIRREPTWLSLQRSLGSLSTSCCPQYLGPVFHSSPLFCCSSTSSRWCCLSLLQRRRQHGQRSWSTGGLER